MLTLTAANCLLLVPFFAGWQGWLCQCKHTALWMTIVSTSQVATACSHWRLTNACSTTHVLHTLALQLTLPCNYMHQAVYLANRAANAENLAHSKARNNGAGQQCAGVLCWGAAQTRQHARMYLLSHITALASKWCVDYRQGIMACSNCSCLMLRLTGFCGVGTGGTPYSLHNVDASAFQSKEFHLQQVHKPLPDKV